MNNNVMEIARINLRGNTMDQGWFKHLTLDNGKPYMVAISVLSEVFYWYKPSEIRDEETNEIRYKQKFKADKLQKSYIQLAETFGFTKRQVKDACDYLKSKGLIVIEFRTIIVNGIRCNNVMFIEPVPQEIIKISILYQDPITLERKRVPRSNVPPSHIKTEEAPTLERKTNTEITTENTTKITTNKKTSRLKFETCDTNAAKYLFEKIKSNNSKQKQPNFDSWANEFRLMREKDNRELQEIKDVIDWCQEDMFWKGNILSPKKLREKFDQLTIQMNSRKGANKRVGIDRKSDDSDSEYIGL
ncbi:DNA replication protein DnaD [Bacillus cereus group sp. TH43LC]|uniref:DNA replication protein DnaD n=1 Tax=unclassified Bacillus cereus group TaxID=2750818 RepID=UPI0022E29AD9|nr:MULTISPECIES: DNA replication protein DnaD [unclassified Bacillus cereus group]MDA1504882.1 DNA replication protein DnaD [Bacillus cereus group sp. TH43LC]MDA1862732.1 DNA replication protein DnaD [Bacillus cereus group sp. BY128LC]HDR4393253.1 DNA replication protein DnaD [Bacillus cereus]